MRFWIVFLFLLVGSFLVGHTTPVINANEVIWDAIESGMPRILSGARVSHVKVVEIGDKDYADMFGSRSPLDSDQLAVLIATAIHRDARRVFVNIATEDPKFRLLPRRVAYALRCLEGSCGGTGEYVQEAQASCLADIPHAEPYEVSSGMDLDPFLKRVENTVVWARGASPIGEGGTEFQLMPVLGGHSEDIERSGVATLQPDHDGRLRRMWTSFRVERSVEAEALYFQAATVLNDSLDASQAQLVSPDFSPYLRPGVLQPVAASTFVTSATSLKDSIVFLGGNYSAASRFYVADGQTHAGVNVVAAISLALADNKLIHHMPTWGQLLVKFGLGLAIAWVNFGRTAVTALLWVLLGLVAVCGFALFGVAIGFMLDLAALLIGVTWEELANVVEKAHAAGA